MVYFYIQDIVQTYVFGFIKDCILGRLHQFIYLFFAQSRPTFLHMRLGQNTHSKCNPGTKIH